MRSSVAARSSAERPAERGSTLRGTLAGAASAVNPQLTRPSTTLSTKIEAEAEGSFHRSTYATEIEPAEPIVRAPKREVFPSLPFGPEDLAERIRTAWP